MWSINHLSEWLRPSLTGKRDPAPPVECWSALLMAPQIYMGEASHPPGLCWVWADHCSLPANQRGVREAWTAHLMLSTADKLIGFSHLLVILLPIPTLLFLALIHLRQRGSCERSQEVGTNRGQQRSGPATLQCFSNCAVVLQLSPAEEEKQHEKLKILAKIPNVLFHV